MIRKGHHADVDSYSAFVEADRMTPTGLAGYLREVGVTRVYCADSRPTIASRGPRSMRAARASRSR